MQDSAAQRYHASTLIRLLHPTPSSTSLIEITGLQPKTTPIKRYFTDVDLATDFGLEVNAQRYSVFVSINARSRFSGYEIDVPAVTAMGLDLQPERTPIADVWNRLALGAIPPTAIGISGNGYHFYLKLSEPAVPSAAKLVWERLVKFTGSDAVHNTNRIFRLAGTLNWKQHTAPKWCYLTNINPERQYTIDQIDYALTALGAAPARQPKEGIPVSVDPPSDWLDIRQKLHPMVLDVIDTGERNAYSERQVSNSEADWLVVCALIRIGCPDEMIHWIYETQPVGIMKYRSMGARYLNRTIESARRATSEPIVQEAKQGKSFGYGHPHYTGGAADSKRPRW